VSVKTNYFGQFWTLRAHKSPRNKRLVCIFSGLYECVCVWCPCCMCVCVCSVSVCVCVLCVCCVCLYVLCVFICVLCARAVCACVVCVLCVCVCVCVCVVLVSGMCVLCVCVCCVRAVCVICLCLCLLCVSVVCMYVCLCVCACVSACADIHIGLPHNYLVCDPHSQLFLYVAPFHRHEFDNIWLCVPLTHRNFRIPTVTAACDHSQTVDTAFLRCTVSVESSLLSHMH